MSQLTRVIALLYRMQSADTERLAAQILEGRKRAWLDALNAEAQRHGCNRRAHAPRLGDLRELRQMSQDDAKSITATWNRDVTAQIEKIYAENPRANRNAYFRKLEAWSSKRDTWKLPQIALVTETTAAEYARDQFRKNNYAGGQRYIFSGPAPTCEDCSRRFAAGAVDEAYVRRYPSPRHIGCPHTWRAVRVPKIACNQLWLG